MQQSKPLNFSFSDLWLQEPRCDWWTPLIIRFRESYNSMSMSCKSTSLKKSSSDCLKLAKQWCSIWVKWCYFWTTAFPQVVEKHKSGVVGNYSIYWLLSFSVTRVPNIMKIRQCFLELHLKMSGCFLRHSVYATVPAVLTGWWLSPAWVQVQVWKGIFRLD